ncbi:thioredoxin domain-containing protein [Mesoterricola silvestris]|uniref:Thioredoxin domain-containing protein n=1 Tax=Mesoterricola silvestris TaxID=2927979 RepID=A0AA48GJ05_9BACT|nr:thioredoxin domain-containing protein [Mesoterricola silvestris]BDU73871.1 thioredoxin domain-containing protein [Mesoterricola silvestris]
MANRLAQCTSPYLLQHARNPVEWNPWDAESLERARKEDKPIFLSIGYSACHWCHVMERESFEDAAVAAELNAHFIPIKVDREERPDLDDLYMGAVQAITGRGGWPMSVWLTPDLKPFYGGTYYPPTPRHGLPAFLQLLESIRGAWSAQRPHLESDAASLLAALDRDPPPAAALPTGEPVRRALETLERAFDPRWGGFGPAPKFPQPTGLELLLRHGSGADRARALRTLDAMAEGGIFDHLGGGFARYSVDAQWLVPHFEKMLYDNALLASCYLEAFQLTGEPRYRDTAVATLDYLLRDLRDPSGGFHSSEDADSEGEEGRFYVFTPAQIEGILGADAPRFCQAYGISAEGCFEHGASVLHRFEAGGATAEDLRARVLAFRDTRPRPGKDDKVLAGWNGLALSALARGHQALGEPRFLEAAGALADFLRAELWRDGGLLRTWRRGHGHTPGFLEDYGAVACGLVDLYEAGFDARRLRWAFELGEILLERFQDPGGGFFGSIARPDLLVRQKPFQDGAVPSGNTLAARALLALARHFDHDPFRRAAEGALRAAAPLLERAPAAVTGMAGVLASALAPGPEVVIAGDPGDPRVRALVAAAHGAPRAGGILSLVEADPALPLHRDRRGTEPAAFVCRQGVCEAPVTDPLRLRDRLTN